MSLISSLASALPSLPSLTSMLPSLPAMPGYSSIEPDWRSRMSTAAWRNVYFLTDSHDEKGGRRLVVHEIIGSDEFITEDLGAKAGEWRLNAYFIGHNYDIRRDEFRAKLATAGAGWLIHPWLGKIWARARDWTVHESNDKGGMAVLTVDFVPGGVTTLDMVLDVVDAAEASVTATAKKAESRFKLLPMSAGALGNLVSVIDAGLDNLRDLISLAALPLSAVSRLLGIVQGAKNDLATLMQEPARYAAAFRSISDALGFIDLSDSDNRRGGWATGADAAAASSARQSQAGLAVVSRLLAAADTAQAMADNPVAAIRAVGVQSAAVDSKALQANVTRIGQLHAQLLTMAAAQLALTQYTTADDRDAALAGVTAALDALLPAMSDDLFQTALSARAAFVAALAAQDLAPAVTRDVVAPLPACLLAHRLGVDETAFIAQNRVWHPLFVQGTVHG